MTQGLDVESLVRAHQADIWRYLRALGCNAHEAEDFAQETFLEVLKKPFEQRNAASTAAYLRLVAKHRLLMERRKQGREKELADIDGTDIRWAEFAGDDGAESRIDALKSCMQCLEPRERQALEMRYKDGAPREQIAKVLNLSDGGAKNLMERARDKLKQCVERKLKQ